MLDVNTAALIFSILALLVMLFQLSLALGAPWGEMAMGGKFPGKFSPLLRVSALAQLLLMAFMALVVLTRAGVLFSEWYETSKSVIWFVVALSFVSAILNTITPSKKERILWSPVTLIMLICVILVACY